MGKHVSLEFGLMAGLDGLNRDQKDSLQVGGLFDMGCDPQLTTEAWGSILILSWATEVSIKSGILWLQYW